MLRLCYTSVRTIDLGGVRKPSFCRKTYQHFWAVYISFHGTTARSKAVPLASSRALGKPIFTGSRSCATKSIGLQTTFFAFSGKMRCIALQIIVNLYLYFCG